MNHERPICRNWAFILPVAVVFYAVLALLAGGSEARDAGILRMLGVPALEHRWMDLRGVAAWCDCSESGGDPVTQETWIRFPDGETISNFRMNYSPLVLVGSWIGLSSRISVWAVLLGVSYVLAVWRLASPCNMKQAMFWCLLICSPCSVLVIERANLDALIFVLLAAAVFFRKHARISAASVLAGAGLKFFPIAGLAPLWLAGGREGKKASAVALMIFLGGLALLGPRLAAIFSSLSGQSKSCFGARVSSDILQSAGMISPGAAVILRGTLLVLACVILVTAFVLGQRHRGGDFCLRSQYAFLTAAPMMILLFLMGTQMDYKWIFLLFLVPAALEMRCWRGIAGTCARSWLILLPVYSW